MCKYRPRHRNRASLRVVALAVGISATISASGQVINEDLKLTAADGSHDEWFGISVAIDDGIVGVGVPFDGDNGVWSGSAYLVEASTGAQIAKLLPTGGDARDEFGYAIAIDNGVVAVGAYQIESVFLFDASTGAQIARLPPDWGEVGGFGVSVAIADGIVAVGALFRDDNGTDAGAAYLFDTSTGEQSAKLLPSDGEAYAQFGNSIAIDNGVVVVGARYDNDNGGGSGSAYLFDASTGAQIAKLVPSDGAARDHFGWSVAIDDGVVAVGAEGDADNGFESGSAYLFDASTGGQIAKLLPNDGAAGDRFGFSIAIDNGVVAVGALEDNGNGSSREPGSAYLFEVPSGAQIAKLLASDGAAADVFGCSIDIDNGVVVVGAFRDDDHGLNSGSSYLFSLPGADCEADLNGDGVVDTRDFITYLNAWANREPIADWNEDGIINTQDFIAYLNDWVVGC